MEHTFESNEIMASLAMVNLICLSNESGESGAMNENDVELLHQHNHPGP